MIQRIATLAALVLLGSTAVEAQMNPAMHGQHGDTVPSMQKARGMMMGGMMGQGMMGSGMMGMMGQGMGMMATGGPGPAAILHMSDDLELSDAQQRALEAIHADLQSQMEGRMTAMMTAHHAAADALDGDVADWEAYEGNLRTAADLMVETHMAMARAAHEARAELTAAQREELDAHGGDMMRGMMGPR